MSGRWPANVILSPSAARQLDEQSGVLKSGSRNAGHYRGLGYMGSDATDYPEIQGDSGGASRFFLEAGYEPWELEWIYSVGLKPYEME